MIYIYHKFPIIFKLEERMLNLNFLVYIFLADLACW